MANKAHCKRGAFTLVELLVVIGIIALLIAILLPALNKARIQARRAQDLSNLHQIALACVSYATENQGSWPLGCISGPGQNGVLNYDQMAELNSFTFDYFLQFLDNQSIAQQWGMGNDIDPSVKRSLACTSFWDTSGTALNYVGVNPPNLAAGGNPTTFLGYIYWGRRSAIPFLNGPTYGQIYDQTGNPVTPATKYVWPVKQGDRPTTKVLLSCFQWVLPGNVTDLPHCKSGDVWLQLPPAALPGDGVTDITAVCAGINFAYTDGSAAWRPRRGLWAMSDGSGFYYFDNGSR